MPPPVFLQRTRRPPSLIAVLALACLLVGVSFIVPGVVLLTRRASDGIVPCRVLAVAPAPLPPARPGALFHDSALSLSFAGADGAVARSVACEHGPDSHAPMKIDYRPSALGITGKAPGGTLVCSVRPATDVGASPATLTFSNDLGDRLDVAVVCPGGARSDRTMRIDYRPHDVGLRSFLDSPGPFNTRGDDGPNRAAATVAFAIAAPLLAIIAWALWRTRRIYVIAPVAAPAGEAAPVRADPRVPVTPSGRTTTVGPTGPGSLFYAGIPGVLLGVVGAAISVALGATNLPAGVALGVAVTVAVVLLTRRILRPGRRDGMVVTVGDETLALALPGQAAHVVRRQDAALVGIKTNSGRNVYWVSEINVWRPDGQVLGSWDPGWPVGRSQMALRRALRRHGWPQAAQSPFWEGRLFHYDPGS